MEFLVFLLFWSVVGGILCAVIATSKNHSAGWAWLGIFLGLIGVLIVACFSRRPAPETQYTRAERMERHRREWEAEQAIIKNSRKCPMCAELVKAEARVCRFCGHTFEDQAAVVQTAHAGTR
jgi:MFS family permease